MRTHLLHHRDLRDIEREAWLLLAGGLLLIGTTVAIYLYAAALG